MMILEFSFLTTFPTLRETPRTMLPTKKQFLKFIKEYQEGNFAFKYRDALKRNYLRRDYQLEVNLADLAADDITQPRMEGEEKVEDIHVTLVSEAAPTSMRDLKSDQVARLVKIPGIVVAATGIRAKATRIAIQCRSCRTTKADIPLKPGLEGYQMPRKCGVEQAGRPPCPLDPYFILPDHCKCVDFQSLKLQEATDSVPHGEMPRHMQLYVDRSLVERAVPGNRVIVIGVYSIRKMAKLGRGAEKGAA